MKHFAIYLLTLIIFGSLAKTAFAVEDPRLVPNNKVGITLLSPDSEIEGASGLVNTNGDWGWVLIIIKKSERNVDRWQGVFNQLAKKRLIPIVRIATDFDNRGYWQKPTDEDASSWADFLNKLYWPTKNHYVQIYNEVNHSQEWGGKVDASEYAHELSKTIDALKSKNKDFFVLNAPLDLALQATPSSLDAVTFYQTMGNTRPGVFSKLDGWASHSYPNPGFIASPNAEGRTSIRGYQWEQNLIANFTGKTLPVFITETGWKRQNGQGGGLDENTIAQFYTTAFLNIWNDKNIVAVTPFVFHFPDDTLGAFSFKANGGTGEEFFKYYYSIKDLIKEKGRPVRENLAQNFEFKIPNSLITNMQDRGEITLENRGNFVWELGKNTNFNMEAKNAKVSDFKFTSREVYPGQTAQAKFKVKGVKNGKVEIKFKAVSEGTILASKNVSLKSEPLLQKIIEAFGVFGNQS